MSINDFEKMGIALAEARMLCQRFRDTEKVRELAEIMSAVRSGHSSSVSTQAKKDRKIAVDVSLHIWSGTYKKYVATRIGKGRRTLTNKFDRTDLLEDIFQYFKQVFFPSGRKRGHLSLSLNSTSIKFCSCANEVITDLSYSIDNYMKNNSLKRAKFIIQAKAMSKLQKYDSDSSLSDFDMESANNRIEHKRSQNRWNISPVSRTRQSCINLFDDSCEDFDEQQMQKIGNETFSSESINKNLRKKKTRSCNYSGNDIVPLESALSSFSEISNKLHETRVLKERQNREYESSLEADRKKAEEREATQKRMEYLDNLKVYRQSKLKTEPYITEDSVLVSGLHTTLGKKQRFFDSDEKCCQIYHWVGSLSAELEFFHLHYKRSSIVPSSYVLDPNLNVTAVETTILTMSEVTESNLTINIID